MVDVNKWSLSEVKRSFFFKHCFFSGTQALHYRRNIYPSRALETMYISAPSCAFKIPAMFRLEKGLTSDIQRPVTMLSSRHSVSAKPYNTGATRPMKEKERTYLTW